ncbi:hypothetical protein AVEN_187412-1, partial [Araneus ventricosus]
CDSDSEEEASTDENECDSDSEEEALTDETECNSDSEEEASADENECDSDSEEEASTDEKSVTLDDMLKNMGSVIKGLEKRNIVSEHDLLLLYKVKEINCNHKMKSMKQLSILGMFRKIS